MKKEVVKLVKNFIQTEDGVSIFDLQMLFGNPLGSVGCNEVFTAIRLNGFNKMAQININPS